MKISIYCQQSAVMVVNSVKQITQQLPGITADHIQF